MSRISGAAETAWQSRYLFAAAAACALLLGAAGAAWNAALADAAMRRSLLRRAVALADAIDPLLVKALAFDPSDIGTPAFDELQDHLAAYRRFHGECCVYTMARRNGRTVTGPSDLPADNPRATPPGAAQPPIPAENDVLAGVARAGVFGPVSTPTGDVMSALAAVRSPRTGATLMAVGIDMPARAHREALLRAGAVGAAPAVGLGLILLAGGLVARRRARRGLRANAWTDRHLETVLAGALGLALAATATLAVHHAARQRGIRRFERHADARAQMLSMTFREIRRDLTGLALFFEGQEWVTAEEFALYAGNLASTTPVIAWGWAPFTPSVQRADIEEDLAGYGGPYAFIYHVAEDGTTARADGRDRYAPIVYVAPSGDETSAALGFDLLSHADRRAAAEAAEATGLIRATPLLPTLHAGQPLGLILYRAVTRPVDERPLGVVFAAIIPPDHLAGTLRALDESDTLALTVTALVDVTERDQPRELGRFPAREDGAEGPVRARRGAPAQMYPIFLAGRTLAAQVYPGPGASLGETVRATAAAAGGGLVLTAVLTAFIGYLRSRQADLERKVRLRTAELHAREEDLAITLRSIGDGVVATDREGRVAWMNPIAEEQLGWTFAEAARRPSSEVLRFRHTRTGAPVPCPIQKVLETGTPVALTDDLTLITRDGCERQIADSVAPIRDDEDTIRGAVLVFRDVTDACRLRDALRESEARYRTLFESMVEGLALHEMIFDDTGRPVDYRFLSVNPAFERATGLQSEAIAGRTVREVEPDIEPFWIETYGRVVQSGQPAHFTHYNAPLQRWFEVSAYRTAPGQFAASFVDITHRHEAERDARAAHALNEVLVGTLGQGIVFEDADRRIRFVNPALNKVFSLTDPSVLVGRPGQTLAEQAGVPPADPDRFLRELDERSTAGTERHGEEIVLADGRILERDYIPVTVDEERRGHYWIYRDVSERKRMETERLGMERRVFEAQRLESLGILAGGIAHDFNNILMTILGNTDLALQNLSPASTVRTELQDISTAARRAAELCRQMLAYAGQGQVENTQLDLNEVIGEMLHLLKSSISKRAVLNLHLEPGLPAILADASQIRQVVMNLIVNASEALEDKSGTLSITTGAARRDRAYFEETHVEGCLADGLYVTVEIADTGCGMAPETIRRIFDPFYTTKFTGRGLGLAAVRGIVRAHRGALKVYSEPGRGTVFKLLFPADEATTMPGPTADGRGDDDAWRGRGDVLLADDEESIRTLAARMLERMGFTPVDVVNGKEAVERFQADPARFSAVVLDLTMPRMNGEEAFAQIRRMSARVPIVIASGYSANELAARLQVRGVQAFLQKPFTYAQFRAIMREAISRGDNT